MSLIDNLVCYLANTLLMAATLLGALAHGSLDSSLDGSLDESLGTLQACEYWVAEQPEGDDGNPGTQDLPWATLAHAAEAARDDNCTIWFKDGLYIGLNELKRRFSTPTTFQAVNDYMAILEGPGPVIELDGVKNMTFSGFEMRHSGPDADVTLMIMDRRDDIYWSEHVQFINNIIHDSYNDDLFKIHNGVRFVTIRGNVFYNQGPSDEQIDVNGVTDVVIEENIFFHDYIGSGREISGRAKHFITIKDSNGTEDDQLSSERIAVRRNVFLNWQGGMEAFVNTGNDGKPYYEASDVTIENNLMLGNSEIMLDAPLSIRGAKNITFTNNTVVGDFPSRAYALRSSLTGANPLNRNILLANNIWADATGTMGAGVDDDPDDIDFATGDPADTVDLALDNNLYWNGEQEIPNEGPFAPLVHDQNPIVADPQIVGIGATVVLPRWNGVTFLSGNQAIREEFTRLVEAFGRIAPNSHAVGAANPSVSPSEDILGRPRPSTPDIGAYQSEGKGQSSQSFTGYLPWLGR